MTLPKGYGAGGREPPPSERVITVKKIKKSDGKEVDQYMCDFCRKINTTMFVLKVKRNNAGFFGKEKKFFICTNCALDKGISLAGLGQR